MSKILLTGSMVYGPVSENSDIDIVMFKPEANVLLNKVLSLGLTLEVLADYGDASSFKFAIADELPPINIIVVDSEAEWFMWEHATKKMKEIGAIDNREERIAAFHIFQTEGLNMAMKEEGRKFFDEYKRTHGVQPFSEAGPPKVQTVCGFTGFDDDDVDLF